MTTSPENTAAEPPLYHYPVIDSTNTELARLAEKGAPHGAAALADYQTAGRGQPGRSWWMRPGGGVLVSVLLRKMPPGLALEDLTLLLGHRLADALRRETGVPVVVKPPNDLYVEGRKLGGILCETRWRDDEPLFTIVGVGLNVSVDAAEFPDELGASAISLAAASGRAWERDDVAKLMIGVVRNL